MTSVSAVIIGLAVAASTHVDEKGAAAAAYVKDQVMREAKNRRRLQQATGACYTNVTSYQKISDTQGGFTGVLNNSDKFGISLATVGDLNGDGISDVNLRSGPMTGLDCC